MQLVLEAWDGNHWFKVQDCILHPWGSHKPFKPICIARPGGKAQELLGRRSTMRANASS